MALGDRAVAVTGSSASLAVGELDECRAWRKSASATKSWPPKNWPIPAIGKRGRPLLPLQDRVVPASDKLAERFGVAVVVDGSNQDDQGDYRPGLRAAREQKVRSPLAECGLTKAEIRQLAVAWELPVWNKPATPCLSSRIAYGEHVTPERLAMIDQAEAFFAAGFSAVAGALSQGDMARIEVPPRPCANFLDAAFRRETVGGT